MDSIDGILNCQLVLAEKGISFSESNQMDVDQRSRLLSIIQKREEKQEDSWKLPEEIAQDPRISGVARVR